MPAKKKFSKKKIGIDDITKLMSSNLVISKKIEKNLKKIQRIKPKKHEDVVQEQVTEEEMQNIWKIWEDLKKENEQKTELENILEKLVKDLKL